MSHESAPLLNRGASARDADGGRSGDDLASDVRGGRGWGNRAWLLACGAAVVGATAIAGVSSSATFRASLGAAASGGDSTFGGARVRASLRGAASARADRWSDFVSPDRATLGEANAALTAQMEQWYAKQPDLLHVPLDGPAPKVVQIVQPQEQEPEEAAVSWDQAAPEEGTGSIDAQWGAGASDGASVYANSGDQVASIGEEWHSLYDSVDPTIPLADDFDKKWRWMDWTQATMQGYVLNSKTFSEAMDRNADGFIVLHAVNGLGNRIRAFSAAKLLANQRGRKLIVIWERDDSLDAPIATMLTPSFLKDSYIIEEWPERLNTAEAELAAWKARGKTGDRPMFTTMHDATTDWGKSHVREVLYDPETWRGAVYIKSSHAELQLNKEEYDFVSNSMADFQPSKEVSNMMKSVPLASKSDDEMISMHIRAGEDAKLSKDLSLAGEGAAEIQLIDSYRRKCSVDSFVNTLVRRAPDAVQRGIDIFVAADEPSDVDDLRARLPNNKIYALDRPDYCNHGYNRARETECMIYAVADLFLLSRNPGPMLRSKFSSFSDFANYYRKRSGRLQGKGFLVNGCEDDGGSDGVLTASLGRDEDVRARAGRDVSDVTTTSTRASTSVSTHRGTPHTEKEAPVAKTSTGGRVVARFAMGVEGAGFGRTDSKLPAGLSDFAADADCAHAWFAQCGPKAATHAEATPKLGDYAATDTGDLGGNSWTDVAATYVTKYHFAASLGSKGSRASSCPRTAIGEGCEGSTAGFFRALAGASAGLGKRDVAEVDMNALIERGAAFAVTYPVRTAGPELAFPDADRMAKLAEAEGVDLTISAVHRDPVAAAIESVAGVEKSGVKSATLGDVIGSLERQAAGYREMAKQLGGLAPDFYECVATDEKVDAEVFKPARAFKGGKVRRALLEVVHAIAPRSFQDSVIEPRVMAAYDALGADAFFYYAHFAPEIAKMPAGEKMGAATRVTMKERVELLKGVQRGLGRALNKMEMLEYVKAENDAYAAYFALRTGPCRR